MIHDPPRITYPAGIWSDRKGQAICAIVVHGTGGGLKSSLQTLKTGDGRGVSIHVLIDKDGTQYVMLPDERGANHAGALTSSFTLNGKTYTSGAVNRATLGVELVNMQDGRDPYPAAQLQSLGWLVAHWRTLHGPLPILRHGDLDPTRRRDPYQLTTNAIEEWVKAAGAVAPTMPPPPARAFVVRGLPVFQQSTRTGPLWGHLSAGDTVVIDDLRTGHLADSRGFVDLAGLEPVP